MLLYLTPCTPSSMHYHTTLCFYTPFITNNIYLPSSYIYFPYSSISSLVLLWLSFFTQVNFASSSPKSIHNFPPPYSSIASSFINFNNFLPMPMKAKKEVVSISVIDCITLNQLMVFGQDKILSRASRFGYSIGIF